MDQKQEMNTAKQKNEIAPKYRDHCNNHNQFRFLKYLGQVYKWHDWEAHEQGKGDKVLYQIH